MKEALKEWLDAFNDEDINQCDRRLSDVGRRGNDRLKLWTDACDAWKDCRHRRDGESFEEFFRHP